VNGAPGSGAASLRGPRHPVGERPERKHESIMCSRECQQRDSVSGGGGDGGGAGLKYFDRARRA